MLLERTPESQCRFAWALFSPLMLRFTVLCETFLKQKTTWSFLGYGKRLLHLEPSQLAGNNPLFTTQHEQLGIRPRAVPQSANSNTLLGHHPRRPCFGFSAPASLQ